MKENKVKVAAVFTVYRASDMNKRGRRNIAIWLRKQADDLITEGKNYSKRTVCRYLYK